MVVIPKGHLFFYILSFFSCEPAPYMQYCMSSVFQKRCLDNPSRFPQECKYLVLTGDSSNYCRQNCRRMSHVVYECQ